MPLSQKIVSAASRAGRALSRHRGSPFAELAKRCAVGFERALDNENFDMVSNGELRVLQIIAQQQPECLFDIGANVGEWSVLAAKLCPQAAIHAFEVVPSTFVELESNSCNYAKIITNDFGLSDRAGEITIYLSEASEDATACPIDGLAMHAEHYVKKVQGKVRTGADYMSELQIKAIDFLKIDVEGMDLRVIKGFGQNLRQVRAVQFEYGVFNIGSHDLLADFCRLLTGHGFTVGQVFPRSVRFFDYRFQMENFHGSNYIAVRNDQVKLMSELAGYIIQSAIVRV